VAGAVSVLHCGAVEARARPDPSKGKKRWEGPRALPALRQGKPLFDFLAGGPTGQVSPLLTEGRGYAII